MSWSASRGRLVCGWEESMLPWAGWILRPSVKSCRSGMASRYSATILGVLHHRVGGTWMQPSTQWRDLLISC